eukprot:2908743-Pleurochrysis_carterae.AAC.2
MRASVLRARASANAHLTRSDGPNTRARAQAVTDQSGNGVAGGVDGVNGDGGDTRALLEDKGGGKGEGKGETEGVVTNNDVDGQACCLLSVFCVSEGFVRSMPSPGWTCPRARSTQR